MLLELYNITKLKVGTLKGYKELKIESVLSTGDKELSFLWNKNGTKIANECYIRTETDEYVVKENSKEGSWRKIVAKLNLEELEGKEHQVFQVLQGTVQECANHALVGTGWRCATTLEEKRRSIYMANTSAYKAIEKICEVFNCERRYDTIEKIIYLEEKIGEDKGAYFVKNLNLKELTDNSDTYDFYTRILPIGKDGLQIDEINGGSPYIVNETYAKKTKTIIWEDTNYTDAQALKEDAEYKLNELSKPRKSYNAKVVDLAKMKEEYSILDYEVGDTVTIIENESDTFEKQRIVKTVEYPDNPERNTCEIANTILSFEEMQKRIFAAAENVESVTNSGIVIGSKVEGMSYLQGQYSEIANVLSAVKAEIGTIETTYLRATEADLKYATISRANILDASIENLAAEYASFKMITTGDITATNARIDNVTGDLAEYKKVVSDDIVAINGEFRSLSARFADINLGNIEAGAIKTAMIDTAAIKSAQIADGAITNLKVAGDLDATKITAGTLSVDRLIFRGTEKSIIYELNNINGATQVISKETLNGEILTERSITADRIVAGSITANEIKGETITANELAVNSVTSEKIKSGSVTAIKIDVGDLFAQDITATGTIRGVKLEGAEVNAEKIKVKKEISMYEAGKKEQVFMEVTGYQQLADAYSYRIGSAIKGTWTSPAYIDFDYALINNKPVGKIEMTAEQTDVNGRLYVRDNLDCGISIKTGSLYATDTICNDVKIKKGTDTTGRSLINDYLNKYAIIGTININKTSSSIAPNATTSVVFDFTSYVQKTTDVFLVCSIVCSWLQITSFSISGTKLTVGLVNTSSASHSGTVTGKIAEIRKIME